MMRVDLRDQPAGLNVFGQPTTLERPRRIAMLLFSLAAIALIALPSVFYLRPSHDWPIEPDSNAIAAADRSMMVDLRASQQKITTELERITQDAEATKADLQNLSDQVSALTAKVGALRDAAAPPTSSSQSNARAQASTKKSSKPIPN